MSRNATPLLVTPPLADLAAGAEVFIVETRLAHPNPTEAGSHEEEHSLCVLLIANPDDSIRRVLRAQVPCYIGALARVESLVGPMWGKQLVELLDAIEPAFLDLVVAWPPADQAVWSQAMASVKALRAAGQHQLCAGVIVGEQPMDWTEEGQDLRFAAAEGMTAQEGSVWLHAALAQLSAPGMVDCVTSEDIQSVFGSPARPARLHLTDAGRLHGVANEIYTSSQSTATARAAAFFLDGVGLHDYSSAAHTLRSVGVDAPVVIAPSGLTLNRASGTAARCLLVASTEKD